MDKKKINILFVHHASGIGGAPISMVKIIKELDKSLYTCKVLLLKDSAVKYLLEKEKIPYEIIVNSFYKKYYNYFTHIAPIYYKWYQIHSLIAASLKWFLSRYYFSNKVLQNYDYDILHLNSLTLTDWLCSGQKRGKTILHVREPLADGYLGIRKFFIQRQVNKYANQIIAISKDNAQRINLPDKTKVIYNYIEIPQQLATVTKKSKIKNVLYLGGTLKYKGFYTVVECLEYLNEDVRILFSGSIDECNRNRSPLSLLKTLIKKTTSDHKKHFEYIDKIKTHSKVKLIGLSNNVPSLLLDSDLLISPFSQAHFSRPVIEAFAYKKPVIGTNVKGMEEIIDHNINGLIVPKNNPKKLADAINLLCKDEKLAKIMGENGYLKYNELYSSRNVLQIIHIYESLVLGTIY